MHPDELYQQVWKRKLITFSPTYQNDNFRIELFRQALHEKWIDPPLGSLLDIGCGNGYLLETVQQTFTRAWGVDISPMAVHAALSRGLSARAWDVDSGHLPFDDGFFNCITCLDTIEHVYDPTYLIAEMSRLLSPGGYAFIITPNIMYHGWLAKLIQGHFPITSLDPEMYNGGHLHHLTYYDLADMMKANGLEPKRHAREPSTIPMEWRNFLQTHYQGNSFELDFGDTVIIASGHKPN